MVPAAAVEGVGERPHLPGHVGAHVDRGLELAPRQHRQVLVAVGEQVLDAVQRRIVGPAPMEEGDLVAAGDRGLDHCPADEAGATDQEDAHVRHPRPRPGRLAGRR